MDGTKPLKYIETIVLEIIDRPRFQFHQWRGGRLEKFNITKFNTREAAYAFLKRYDGESFVKAQQIMVYYNNQVLHLCVRDLIYGTTNNTSRRIPNSMVEFVYRKVMFSEIKWSAVTVNRTTRVRWAEDNEESATTTTHLPEIHINGDYSPINIDETANVNARIVPCISCNNLDDDQSLSIHSTQENTNGSFCETCRVRRSVSGLQRLISCDDKSLTLGHVTDDENHFRSSIYVHVNQIQNS